MVVERLSKMRQALRRVVLSDAWAACLRSITAREIREKAKAFEALVLSPQHWAKIQEVLELTEEWHRALRVFDSDKATVGVSHKIWLELEAAAKNWEASKFDKVELDGTRTVAFVPADGLLPMRNTEAIGAGSSDDWTVLTVVAFRWNKMCNSGGTGMMQAAGFAVHPTFVGADMTGIVEDDFHRHLEFHHDDAALVNSIHSQWEDFCAQDPSGPLFKVDGKFEVAVHSCDRPRGQGE